MENCVATLELSMDREALWDHGNKDKSRRFLNHVDNFTEIDWSSSAKDLL